MKRSPNLFANVLFVLSLIAIAVAVLASPLSARAAGVVDDWSFLDSNSNSSAGWTYGRTYAFTDAGVQLGATPPPAVDNGAWIGMMWVAPGGLSFSGSGVEIQYYAPDSQTPPTSGYELMTMLHQTGTKQGFSVGKSGGTLNGNALTKQVGEADSLWTPPTTNGLVGSHTLSLVSVDGGNVQTYLDGTLVNTRTGTTITDSLNHIGIGNNSVNGNWYWPFGSVINRVRTFTVDPGSSGAAVTQYLLPVATWNGGAGTWTGTSNPWSVGGSPANWTDGSDAIFGNGADVAGDVTVGGTVKPNSISFNNTSDNSAYKLLAGTGDKIDFNGNTGVITVAENMSAEIATEITNGKVVKSGDGILTLSGANTYTGATVVSDGTLNINAGTVAQLDVPTGAANLNSPAAATTINVSGDGLLSLAGSVVTLNVTGGTVTTGTGATAGTASLSSGTVNAGAPLAISSTLKVSGATATYTAGGGATAFTVQGSSIQDDTQTGAGARTITLSGGTLSLAGPAVGTASYTTANTYDFSPAADNLIATLSPSDNTNTAGGNGGTGPVTKLTDGVITTAYADTYTIGNNATITYTLPGGAAAGYDLSKINLYSGWGDGGRKNITLNDISYSTVADPNTFIPIAGSGVNYNSGRNIGLASLEAPGALLAGGVAAIQFNFGPQQNNWVGYRELEVVGAQPETNFPNTHFAVTSTSTLDLPEGTKLGSLTLSGGSQLTLSGAGSASFAGLSGTGTVAGTVTIPTDSTVSPGTDSTISTLAATGLTLESGTFLTFNITDDTTLDQIDVTGTDGLTILGGDVSLFAAAGTTAFSTEGTYDLIGYDGSLGGDVANLSVDNKVVGRKYTFNATGSFIALTIGASGYWNGAGGTAIWSESANWNGIAPTTGDTLVFSTAGAGGATLDNDIVAGSFGSMQFESGAPAFTLGGNGATLTGNGSEKFIIVNGSTETQTVNLAIALGANGTIDAASGAVVVDGVISGGHGLTKTGDSQLTLSGSNTYTGGTTINAGAVVISGSGTIGTGGDLTLGGGSLDLGGTGQTVGAVSVTAAAAGGDTISSGSLTGASYAASNAAGEAIISANLAGGAAGLAKSGDGTLTLSGNNTYTGPTSISAGALKLGAAGALPQGADKGDVTVDGTLDLNGISTTINGFSGAGAVTNGDAAAVVLTVGGGDKDGSFFGLIEDGSGGGTVAIAKIGGGTQTIAGASTYAGGTTVSTGTLVVGNKTALGTGTLTLADGTTFGGAGFEGNNPGGAVSNPVVLSGGNVNMQAGAGFKDLWLSGAISGSGGINAIGGGRSLTLAGDNSFTGGVVVQDSTIRLQISHQNALGTGTLTWEQTSASALGLAAKADLRGNETYPNGVPNNIVIAENGIFGVYGDGSMELSGVISGDTGSLKKRHSGNLVLSGDNTYRGGTTVDHGTLTVNGSLADSTMTINTAPASWGGGNAPGVVNGTGTLNFNIDGATCDLIQVINGGTLDMTGLNITIDAVNVTESAYVIVDWDIEGAESLGILIGDEFASIPDGWAVDYDYLLNSKIALMADLGLPGDADENGVVNAADYIALKRNMGQPTGATLADGDFDDDGAVDWTDLQVLQAHYGESKAGPGTIPEPATLVLLAAGLPALLKRRQRRS